MRQSAGSVYLGRPCVHSLSIHSLNAPPPPPPPPQMQLAMSVTEAVDSRRCCRLQCHDDTHGFEDVYHGGNLLYKLQGLEAGTSYSLRVAAVNAVGKGCWSEEAQFATTRLPPQPPAGLECTLDADPLHR